MRSPELLIGELANRFGLSSQAIRYYERLKLLGTPDRTSAGYRVYSQETLERLELIQHAQSFGLSLSEIKQLIEIEVYSGDARLTFKHLVEAHLEELKQQIQRLDATRQNLAEKFELFGNLLSDKNLDRAKATSTHSLLNLLREVEAGLAVEPSTPVRDKASHLLQLYGSGKRDFQGIELIGAKLNGSILSEADFSRSEMMMASLNEVCMVKTKLKEAYLNGADLVGAYLERAEMARAVLIGADLSDADLREANLIGSNLGGAILRGANLQGANLSEAVLMGADLSDADLRGAILIGSNLFESNLKDAIVDREVLEHLEL